MLINQTPIRTAKNFHANEIEVPDREFLKELKEFNSRTIYVKSEKEMLIVNDSRDKDDDLLYEDTNIEISDECGDISLVYGVSKEHLQEVNNFSNQKIKILAKQGRSNVNISFDFDDNNTELVDKIVVTANDGAILNIMINYSSNLKDTNTYHNGVLKIIANENSVVNVIIINMLDESTNNVLSIQNDIKDNATVDYTMIELGGKTNISNYYSNLDGKNSSNNLDTMYLGAKDELIDMNYIIHCFGEKTNANIEVQGALKDNAIKHFKGTIDFKKGAKKSIGNENENCLLLSDKAKSLALPMLLCSEEDVVGNHSTSSGKSSPKELFYLESRGFSEKEAMKLLVMAKFNKIISKIKSEDIEEQIQSYVEQKLD